MTWHIQPLLCSEETDLQRSLHPGFTSRRRFSEVVREERRHMSRLQTQPQEYEVSAKGAPPSASNECYCLKGFEEEKTHHPFPLP